MEIPKLSDNYYVSVPSTEELSEDKREAQEYAQEEPQYASYYNSMAGYFQKEIDCINANPNLSEEELSRRLSEIQGPAFAGDLHLGFSMGPRHWIHEKSPGG